METEAEALVTVGSKIKIEDIQLEAKQKGWKLISTQYKNMDTVLEFECDEGHSVFLPYKTFRKGADCPSCRKNPNKVQTDRVAPKQKGKMRILAIDQATKNSGWAVFDGKKLTSYGAYSASGNGADGRISNTRQWLESMVENWRPDKVYIEDIQLQNFAQKGNNAQGDNVLTYKILAQLQGVIINLLFDKKVDFEVVHVSSWRKHNNILGRTRTDQKTSARNRVKSWFEISVTEDEADAICIGIYATDKSGQDNMMISW